MNRTYCSWLQAPVICEFALKIDIRRQIDEFDKAAMNDALEVTLTAGRDRENGIGLLS
jgi:hypothetical protein